MATAEPPPKKRKLLETLPRSSSPSPSSSCKEEITRKSRNKDELRALFECYKKIRVCVERNDHRLMPDLEQAYISLITASQGCSSVQRIVAELIPRYVSYCTTALDAGTNVSINMYNWNLSLISKGEDTDQSAYHTAKACIIGLAEICHTASHEALPSSVFAKILTFFASSFEGRDIYQIGRDQIEKLQDPSEFLYQMKVESEHESNEREKESYLNKLFEIRVLSLFCMFVSSPRNLMEVCFGESDNLSDATVYFINQICHDFKGDIYDEERENDETHNNCFLEMVVNRDPAFKSWIISKHKNLNESRNPSEISSHIERVLSSLPEPIDEKESQDIPMEITEESPESPPPKENNSIEAFTAQNNQKAKEEKNVFTNNATSAPLIFDFNENRVSSLVVSASKELWISYLNTNALEPSLRSKFEEFGPINKFLNYPPKKFALIEYKNIYDSVKAHGFMQGSSIWGGSLKVKYLDRGLGSKGFAEGVAIGDSCFVYVGNVLSQQERDEILGELTGSGLRLPLSFKDLLNENALLMEFGSAEEAAIAKSRIRLRTNGNDKFAPGRSVYSSQPSPMASNDSAGPCTPGPQVFRPNWPMDPSYPGPSPSSIDRQSPHTWPHRPPTRMDPKLAHVQGTAIRPPIFPPPVSPSFLPPSPFLPSTNQISPHAIPPGNFRTPRPFIPSSVTPLSQIPGASVQNSNRIAPPPPPPTVVPTFVPPPQPVPNSVEWGNNNNKWRGVLSKSGVNYCSICAVREESDACRYTNGASEPKDWPSKLDVTKRTDIKNVRTTFSNIPAAKREVCRLLPTSASDQKGFGDFITYLKQRECAGVIKIPGVKPMWSRLLFILPHSADNCVMLGINPNPSDCLIALVLPKDTNSE